MILFIMVEPFWYSQLLTTGQSVNIQWTNDNIKYSFNIHMIPQCFAVGHIPSLIFSQITL